jgi:NodT family efflux transporter outer membrane factor (OMF) lipoprotein
MDSFFRKMLGVVAAGAIVLSQMSCTVGPNYQPPKSTITSDFAAASTQPASTQPSNLTSTAQPITEWWTTLNDPELNSLLLRAMDGNLNLQRAASRVRESRQNLRLSGAKLLPTVSGTGSYVHLDGGKNAGLGSSSGSSSSSSSGGTTSGGSQSNYFVTEVFSAGFDANWELDVFGGQRRQIEAARADYAASVEDRHDVLISLLAEVAHDYLELRGLQERLHIAEENLRLQQDSLELTRSLRHAGFSSELDVSRAQTQVAQTRGLIVPLRTATVQAQHAIATLLGAEPDALASELESTARVPTVPPLVTIGMPSDLLRRRPDIRRAERQIAAANARVGAAIADFYPKFSLTGAFGLDATRFQSLFELASRYFLIYPSVSWKLLDFGRTKTQVDMQREEYKQAVLGYQDALLGALREVEDAQVAYMNEQEHHAALADAVASARDSVTIARDRYKQGLTDFLQVLDAQRQLLSTEDDLAQSDQAIATNLVALYKALGGGWEIEAVRQETGQASVAGSADGAGDAR